MANLSDAIAQSFADRYDSQKQAVSQVMLAEAKKINDEVMISKLNTGKEIRKELQSARAEAKPDMAYIQFLESLLNQVQAP